jgi:hypothetical protein
VLFSLCASVLSVVQAFDLERIRQKINHRGHDVSQSKATEALQDSSVLFSLCASVLSVVQALILNG